jgi:unsaturated rhamnogalacturonyl hydrolase
VSQQDTRELLALAGGRTIGLAFRIWGYGEGPALVGLLACSDILNDPRYERAVVTLVEPYLQREPLPEDHVAPAELLVALRHRHGDDRYLEAARRWAQLVLQAPRPAAGQPQVYRPDLFGLANVAWVDTMYSHGPGLAACGYPEEGLAVMAESCRFLQDDSGLFAHGYDVVSRRTNGVHWGRGCGWALLGIVQISAYLQDAALTAACSALLAALASCEEEGRWHTVVDNPSTPLENSVSAFVAAGICLGIRRGVVAKQYAELAGRARAAAVASLIDGDLPVSEATPAGNPDLYATRRLGRFPWGQGPLLLALAAEEGWALPAEPSVQGSFR